MTENRGPHRLLSKRKYSKGGVRAFFFSDRSGVPFPYDKVCVEPGTGLIVAREESDGKWNRVAMAEQVVPPSDAQELKYSKPGVLATEYYSS